MEIAEGEISLLQLCYNHIILHFMVYATSAPKQEKNNFKTPPPPLHHLRYVLTDTAGVLEK